MRASVQAKDTEMKRSYAVAAVAAVALLGSAGAASADELYPPPPEPTLEVSASSLCVGDVPYLEWEGAHGSDSEGADDATVTVTFLNPSGADHVLSGQPLSGRILWPGAAADSEGKGTDWPGWEYVDGTWVEGDEWDWVVPTADIEFKASPSVVLTVAYPLPSAVCAGPPDAPPAGPEADEDDGLPDLLGLTGNQTAGLLAGVAGLIAAGTVLVAIRRRTQH